jgi:hypothetical protein
MGESQYPFEALFNIGASEDESGDILFNQLVENGDIYRFTLIPKLSEWFQDISSSILEPNSINQIVLSDSDNQLAYNYLLSRFMQEDAFEFIAEPLQ